MMNNPYNLHSWSKDYRAQVMDTARRRDLSSGYAGRPTGCGVWTSLGGTRWRRCAAEPGQPGSSP